MPTSQGSRGRRAAAQLALAAAVALTAVTSGAVRAQATPTACADGGICAVGDVGPGGGIVFFVRAVGPLAVHHVFLAPDHPACEDDGCSDNTVDVSLTAPEQAALPFDYLEVAPASDPIDEAWDAGNSNVPGATSSAVGAGAANTAAILAARPGDSPAAHYTDTYTSNSLSDWFLPSLDELRLVLVVKQTFGTAMGTFGSRLWPSTQYAAVEVHALDTTNAAENGAYKSSPMGVRPIRAFSRTFTDVTTTTTTAPATTTPLAAPPAPVTVPPTTTTTIAAP
ncbi:MAG: hypothetical protein JWO68_3924, partial [Actinomycetia bacterium]|nr:hypothetical protein [Actinomycetes bacterium]